MSYIKYFMCVYDNVFVLCVFCLFVFCFFKHVNVCSFLFEPCLTYIEIKKTTMYFHENVNLMYSTFFRRDLVIKHFHCSFSSYSAGSGRKQSVAGKRTWVKNWLTAYIYKKLSQEQCGYWLAHLIRRLRGELIVYRSSRRPSVRLCVRLCVHTFKHEYI